MKNISIILSILLFMNDVKAKKGQKQYGDVKRMIGGTDASLEDWNFIVYLSFHQENPLWKTCGGALISKNLVVTVAHCIEDIVDQPEKVRVGVQTVTRTTNFVKGKNISVTKIIPHFQFKLQKDRPNLEAWSVDADIALLKLGEEVTGDGIPVKLPWFREEISQEGGLKCKAAGWGKTARFETAEKEHKGEYEVSDKLKQIDVTLNSKETCLASLSDKAKASFGEMRRMLCGGKKDEEQTPSPCIGDSGSPLVCKNGEGVDILQGLVVTGPGLCAPGKDYQYFVRVSPYTGWLERMINEN